MLRAAGAALVVAVLVLTYLPTAVAPTTYRADACLNAWSKAAALTR